MIRKYVITVCSLLILSTKCAFSQNFEGASKQKATREATGISKNNTHDQAIAIIENKGQWPAEANFMIPVPGGEMYVLNNGFLFNYVSLQDVERIHHRWHDKGEPITDEVIRQHAYKVTLLNAQPPKGIAKEQKRANYYNYFLGNDKNKWAAQVHAFGKIIQQEVYPFIDMVVYEADRQLKYDFVIQPGGDPAAIQLKYEDVELKILKTGQLKVITSVNEVIEEKPYVYQWIDGKKTEVLAKYQLENNILTYVFPNGYDKRYTLIIDPTLVFATYSRGGGAHNGYYATSSTYDLKGSLYASGYAWGNGWPTTQGAYQRNFRGITNFDVDVCINKYTPNGTTLIYSTYLGGNGTDIPYNVNVNQDDELVIAGATYSSDFPTTETAYDRSLGGTNDLFITQISADGSSLIGSTYMGGNNLEGGSIYLTPTTNISPDDGRKISSLATAIDSERNIWVVSNSNSNNFPVTDQISQNTYTTHVAICRGGSYQFGSRQLQEEGVYEQRFPTVSGCDSLVKLHLSYFPATVHQIKQLVCKGDSVQFGNKYVKQPGIYLDTFLYSQSGRAGCDSIVQLILEQYPQKLYTHLDTICWNETYTFGGKIYDKSGTYLDTFSGVFCDSIVVLGLYVRPLQVDTIIGKICENSAYQFGGKLITTPGIYVDTLENENRCLEVRVLKLQPDVITEQQVYHMLCANDSILIADSFYKAGTRVTEILSTVLGCDSYVVHVIKELNTKKSYTNRYICSDESTTWNGLTLNASGTYEYVTQDKNGCDSIAVLNLWVEEGEYYYDTVQLCLNKPYPFGSQLIHTHGTYTEHFSRWGCDSIVVLTVLPALLKEYHITENYCEGSRYYFNGKVLQSSGNFVDTFVSATGCKDSIVHLSLATTWGGSTALQGGWDGVLFKLNRACSDLMFSKYIGGSGNEVLMDVVFNNLGQLIISGTSNSNNFPTTEGIVQPYNAGEYDGVVFILNPNQGTLSSSTYLGTDNLDHAVMLQVNADNHIYVLGRTLGNYPIDADYVPNANGDVFVNIFNKDLTQSLKRTRLGNVQNTMTSEMQYTPTAFLVDICENIYVAGYTFTSGANGGKPLSDDAYLTNVRNFWFGVLNPDVTGLVFGTYFGTDNDHNHTGTNRFDPNGIVYQSVCCNSFTYPGTTNAVWGPQKMSGGQDIVSFKFDTEASGVVANFELDALISDNDTGCVPYTIKVINTSSAGLNFYWDFGDGNFSTEKEPTYTYTKEGRYRLKLIALNDEACIKSDTVYMDMTLVSVAPPIISVSDSVIVCDFTDSLKLTVNVQNVTPNTRYEWGPPTGISGIGRDSVVYVNPFENDKYYVIVKDTIPGICGIATVDTVQIEIAPRQLAIINNDTAVCVGTLIPIATQGNYEYTYKWSPEIGVNDPDIPNPIIQAQETTRYTLTASYPGCEDTTASFFVDVHEFPWVELGADKFVCQGTEVDLESIVQPHRDDYKYLWLPEGAGLKHYDRPNTTFIADTHILFTLLVETSIGCGGGDTINVYVHPKGFGSVMQDTGICPNEKIQLWADGGISYRWMPEETLDSAHTSTPWAFPQSTTAYEVHISDDYGCTDTLTINVAVYPHALISMPDSLYIYPAEQLQFGLETNCLEFEWFPPSGINDIYSSNPSFSPDVRTRYYVTAKTMQGCVVRDSIDILPLQSIIDMPNAFRPNGVNSVFKVVKRGIAHLHSFQIFNRWGTKLFETTNIEDGWDGTYQGKSQSVGVYVYRIEATTVEGKHFVQNGNVTLLR